MNQLFEWASRFIASWKFWVVVPPWDIGVRVRLGKVAASLSPGLHFRIPGLDEIVLVNTRLRLVCTPTVTIPGQHASKARVVTAQVAYSIEDPVRAMLAYTTPESAISALAQAAIAAGRTADEALVILRGELEEKGVTASAVYYTEDVEVRTYRLLQGSGNGIYSGASFGTPMSVGGPSVSTY